MDAKSKTGQFKNSQEVLGRRTQPKQGTRRLSNSVCFTSKDKDKK